MQGEYEARRVKERAQEAAVDALLPGKVREAVTVTVRHRDAGLTTIRVRVKMRDVPDREGSALHGAASST